MRLNEDITLPRQPSPLLVRWQILVHHAHAAHIYRVIFLSALNASVQGKMFQTGHDAVGSQNLFCAHIHALVA